MAGTILHSSSTVERHIPLQHVKRHTDVQVVHSDRLKPCPRDVRVATKEKVRRPRSPVPTHVSERPSTSNFAPYIDLEQDDPPMRIQSPTVYGGSQGDHIGTGDDHAGVRTTT
ncbi:hypothetical protein M514_23297 [Trichuris suis]|uniref:Uncharacterized protein n=1 Tax=Trichuris suis TaxID=68888 RepID=A0A085N4Q4_9BILA|nr:hypothetical protein M514_23297 [Trichuris suis]